MKYKYILFDMDGTLIDSSPGITAASQTRLRNSVLIKNLKNT